MPAWDRLIPKKQLAVKVLKSTFFSGFKMVFNSTGFILCHHVALCFFRIALKVSDWYTMPNQTLESSTLWSLDCLFRLDIYFKCLIGMMPNANIGYGMNRLSWIFFFHVISSAELFIIDQLRMIQLLSLVGSMYGCPVAGLYSVWRYTLTCRL